MTKILGIDFAPLNVPLRRRIQTLSCLHYVFIFLIGGFGCIFLFIYLLFTRFYWISLTYALWWYVYDRDSPRTGGRPSRLMRSLPQWKYMAEYFPAKLHKTVDLDPEKSYIFGLHPHGILQISGFLSFMTEGTGFSKLFPKMVPHLLILDGQFWFPFYRNYLMSGGSASVCKESIRWVCSQPGHIACIVVGGAIEALEAQPGKLNLVIKKRKGFIKQALVNGSSLVPVFSFGETDVYEQFPNPEGSMLKRFQLFLTHKVFGFSPPVFKGRGIFNYTFGVMPFRRPLNTVVGQPIDVEKIEKPTQEDIDNLHEKYVEELKKLFEENKSKFGMDESAHLNLM